jgi:hypothetical protein
VAELREQLGDGIALNPDAPKPPFSVWMSLPSRWSLLDTNPGTWRRSADTLIDTTFRGVRLSASHRREVLGVIEGLVADVQASGACVSLIVAGRRPGGGAATLGMHIAFADDGMPAGLARVAQTLPRSGTRTELATPVGPALLQRERMTMTIPGTATLAALTSLQVFVPIPATTWTAVIASASAFPELTDPLEQLLVGVAESFRLVEDEDGESASVGLAPPDGAEADVDVRPAARSTGPGIERGFRTMIVKRFGDVSEGNGG